MYQYVTLYKSKEKKALSVVSSAIWVKQIIAVEAFASEVV